MEYEIQVHTISLRLVNNAGAGWLEAAEKVFGNGLKSSDNFSLQQNTLKTRELHAQRLTTDRFVSHARIHVG
jgi:hypothetical protein